MVYCSPFTKVILDSEMLSDTVTAVVVVVVAVVVVVVVVVSFGVDSV